jgi:DNA adenine methylase
MSYDGGKGGAGVAQWIINQIPPHRTYIEAFAGGAAIARTIRPAERTILIEVDPDQAARLRADPAFGGTGTRSATVICGDALTALTMLKKQRQIDAQTFLYADPPYLLSTRSTQRPIYRHEFGEIEQHRQLLTALRRLPCMVAISGYWSALYEMELAGWRASQFWTVDRGGNRREEWLWMNYAEPLELHDYRFLGSNFRERERIKRKKARWTARLARMDSLERLCLMEAVAELRSSIVASGDIDERDPIAGNGELAQHQVGSPQAAIPDGIATNDDAPAPLDLAMVPG